MWVYFNSKGQVQEILTHGNLPRAGTNAFEIFCVFEDLDIASQYTSACVFLIKPDLNKNSYPHLLMEKATKEYIREPEDGEVNYFQDGTTYTGYLFDFAAFGEDQDGVILLDTSGNWTAMVTLFSTNKERNVQGAFKFFVGSGVETLDSDPFDFKKYMEEIIARLAMCLPKDSPMYMRVVNNLSEGVTDGKFKSDLFSVGSVLFNKTDNSFYVLDSLEYVPGVNPRKLPISGGEGPGTVLYIDVLV